MLLETVKDSPVFSSLVESLAEKGVEFSSLKSSMQERIARLVKFAPGPASTCAAKPDLLLPLLKEGVLEEGITSEQLQSRLRERMESVEDPWLAIRRFHRMHIMRIALRDLCELAEIDKITEELSDLADAVIAAIHDLYWEELIGQYGIPYCMEKAETAHLCVIAMGKHGGRELNFSSDVDLMFVYDYEGETEGDASGSVENQAFFTILARKICDFLTKTTPEGYLYRVDTRLRPEGEHGPLASSLSMIEEYYHSYGQNWERQALLKARPVAGHSEVGQKFLKLINPFTYRKYVDELEIADVLRTIDAMRNKSLEQLGSQQNRYLDFKNGYGGIRDIEFFAQAVQILYGGQYPEIRQAGTLLTLLRMHESGLLHSREFGVLALAYRFLRRIEHRMQMEEERQVYKLPTNEQGLQWLAENMGYPSAEELTNQYNQTTAQVRELYQGVFKRKEWEDDTEVFLEKDTFDGEIEDILKSYNFQNPRSAFNFLQALKYSPDPHLQPKTNRLFKTFLPRLLSCLKQSPDPDMALGNFEKLVTSFRARSALYETFSDQPPYVDLLVSVISGSSFLTRLVLRDPSLMETIGRDFTFEESITRESLQTHFHLLSQYGKSDVRDRLLRVQNAAMLRSGIRFILGLCSVEEMGHELAIVADFILAESMPPCHDMMRERYADFTDKYAGEIGILG
ncbi:hypothetical protein GF373_11705, partial [bacterium]|nr:hypothetical protein [bacterium]